MSKNLKPASEMTNEEIHIEMNALQERMKELKSNIKPTKQPTPPPLHELNAMSRKHSKKKTEQAQKIAGAVKMALDREAKKQTKLKG